MVRKTVKQYVIASTLSIVKRPVDGRRGPGVEQKTLDPEVAGSEIHYNSSTRLQ